MVEKRNEKMLADLKKVYVESIMMYLETGEFKTPINIAFMTAYDFIHDISNGDALDKGNAKLYEYYKAMLREYAVKAMIKIKGKTKLDLIKEFSIQCKNYTILAYWMSLAFDILDSYIKKIKGLPLVSISLKIFEEEVIEKVIKLVADNIFEQLHAEKEGANVDMEIIRNCAKYFKIHKMSNPSLIRVGHEIIWDGKDSPESFKKTFDEQYIKTTIEHFSVEATKWIAMMSCPEYCEKALELMRTEEANAAAFLSKDSTNELLNTLGDAVITKHVKILVNKEHTGANDLIEQNRVKELKMLTSLLSRKPQTFIHVIEKLSSFVSNKMKSLAKDTELIKDHINYVIKLISLKKELDTLVKEGFLDTKEFAFASDKAIQEFFVEHDYIPQYLAKYIDYQMRVGLKGKEEKEKLEIISSAFNIFRLLKSKDTFGEVHKQLYGKRLLQGSSISDDDEDKLINLMKIELGVAFVSPFTQMSKDIKTSKEIADQFKEIKSKNQYEGPEVNVKVITSGVWPNEENYGCKMPPELHSMSKRFEDFYKLQHTGRNLKWLASQGDCEILATLGDKNYTLILTLYQTSILMLFQDSPILTYGEVKQMTNLPEEILYEHIYNMINPKMGRLLIKERGKDRNLLLTEKLTLNTNYKNASLRVSLLPSAVSRRPDPEDSKKGDSESKQQEELLKQLAKRRAAILQSTIVKIMKGRRTLGHNDLIIEVIKLILEFKPTPAMIKQEIEYLIEADYLKRDEKIISQYIYVP